MATSTIAALALATAIFTGPDVSPVDETIFNPSVDLPRVQFMQADDGVYQTAHLCRNEAARLLGLCPVHSHSGGAVRG